MLRKIWERYIFFASLKAFLFFLACFYIIFIVIDFSTQSVRFYSDTTPAIVSLFIYYFCQFAKYIDIFFPLAFLFTIIKVFSDMNTKNELVALQTAGLSAKVLTRPLFYFAFILTACGYLNYEYSLPQSLVYISDFRKHYKKDAEKDKRRKKVHVLPLSDESKLVYANPTATTEHLTDVYWLRENETWHFKTLDLTVTPPIGTFVDLFHRDENRHLIKFASYDKLEAPEIKLAEDAQESILPHDSRPLSHLAMHWWHEKFSSEDEKNEVLTYLNYRLAIPLFSLLILMTCVPYTMRFSRHIPLFFISSACLFAFVFFYTMIDAAFILAENQVFSPFTTIWLPFMIGFVFSSWNFARHQ